MHLELKFWTAAENQNFTIVENIKNITYTSNDSLSIHIKVLFIVES